MNREWALWLAAQGFRVFPVWGIQNGACRCPAGPGCGAAGKHPMIAQWIQEASLDPEVIERWVQDPYFLDCNIGIEGTGWVFVDVDPRNGGHEALELWRRSADESLWLPKTRLHITGSLGWHMVYRLAPGLEVKNGPWLRGVEIKTAGGLVVAPGSLHKSGRYYTVEDPDVPIAWLPPAFVDRELRRAAEARRRDVPRVDPVALLDGVAEGERNQTLFDACWQLRWEHGVDEAGALAVVLAAGRACSPPYPDADCRDVVQRVYSYEDRGQLGLGNVIQFPLGQWATGRALVVEPEPEPAIYELNDRGNASRLVVVAGADLRYSDGLGWHVWDGIRWQRDPETAISLGAAEQLIDYMDTVERPLLEQRPRAQHNEWNAHRKQSGNAARLQSALKVARSRLYVAADDFDADDWVLNTPTGLVDLRSGEVLGRDARPLVTKVTESAWDPSARCPRWLAFLELVIPDPEDRAFLQRAMGYSLTGDTSAKAMMTLWGSGNNGKTAFLETCKRVLGDYAMTASKSVFVETRSADHDTVKASLRGARLVTFSELNRGDKLNASQVKEITGGESVRARYMRQDEFEFKPRCKIWLGTNYKPGLSDFGTAMKDRLRLVPFVVVVPAEMRRDLGEVVDEFVREEGAGILAWAWAGLQAYLGAGLGETWDMAAAKADWIEEEDVLGQWLEGSLVRDDGWWTSSTSLHQAYRYWAAQAGFDHPLGPKAFTQELQQKGYARRRGGHEVGGARGFLARLRDESRVPGIAVQEWAPPEA